MALTINTNMGSLIVQNNLDSATKALNQSIERMTTGYKINRASDDAAGFAVATKMETQLGSTTICQNNVAIGTSLLATTASNFDLITAHMQRIRDLTEQGANGTYGQDSQDAMKAEVEARLAEIDRISNSTDFNGIKLLNGDKDAGLNLQIGIDSSTNSVLALSGDLFKNASASSILGKTKADFTKDIFQTTSTAAQWSTALDDIDKALADITTRQTNVGAYQNRLDSTADALTVQFDNITSSLSTIKDADVAAESSNYIKAQILQQASATLLSTANQTPSIALNLI